MRSDGDSPAIAFVPAVDTAEDWLEPLSLSVESYVREVRHGGIFSFADALQRGGARPVVILVSSRATAPRRLDSTSIPGAVWILPEPRGAAATQRWTVKSRRLAARLYNAPLRRARPYLSTPKRPLAAVLRQEGCAAVLCQEYEALRFETCLLVGRRVRVPVYATFQGLHHTATYLEALVRPFAMRRAAGFIIGSEAEAARVRSRYGVDKRRITSLPNPIDTSYWNALAKSSARAELGIEADARVVAWHGRMELPTKGLDLLLAAWGRVTVGARPGSRQLWLLGDGEAAPQVRSLLQRLDPCTVHWKRRFVSRADEVRTFLSAADVYVLPSRREGMPLAALEAMSCGLPVVATTNANASGFLDLPDGRQAGIEVKPDPDALARALRRLVDDPQLRERTSRWAREQAETRFDTEIIAPRLTAFLTGSVV